MDVGNSIGATRQQEVLLEWTSERVNNKEFVAPQYDEKEKIRADAKERHLAYISSKKLQGKTIN